MLLNHNEILRLLEQGVVQGAKPEHVNGTSLDITLGTSVLVELPPPKSAHTNLVDYAARQPVPAQREDITGKCYDLYPGEFILASSAEIFNLPLNISAEYKLKSSMARIGLQHLNAGWCDPGWHGSALTMELVNVTQHNRIRIRPGDRIGQMVFFKHTPVQLHNSYTVRGRYNNDAVVHGIKI